MTARPCPACNGAPFANTDEFDSHTTWVEGVPFGAFGRRLYRCEACRDTAVEQPRDEDEATYREHDSITSMRASLLARPRGLFVEDR